MAKQPAAQICSIFGQVESVVAKSMVDEGKFTYIPAHEIPPTAAVNDAGKQALFAVIIPREYLNEFENRVRTLRA